jgi:hypothetical protein
VIYQSSNRLFTIFKNAKPPKIINQIINKLEKAISFIIRLIPHSFLVFVNIISKSYANQKKQVKFIEIKEEFKI